jgi:hypothetical protein
VRGLPADAVTFEQIEHVDVHPIYAATQPGHLVLQQHFDLILPGCVDQVVAGVVE